MRGTGAFLRDNLEAFAVAIAMALVIRHFCVEAFRIPTGSMMPTLYGDEKDRYHPRFGESGDRILVDKFAWMRRDPRRWEVAVFHFPLNWNKNFIKRIGGLPGEWLRIVDGDLWTSTDEGATWSIARKPEGVQDQLFIPYWPSPPDFDNGFDEPCWRGDPGWTADEEASRFTVDTEAHASLDFVQDVYAYEEHAAHEKPLVGDVRVSFTADVADAGALEITIVEHATPYVLRLGADGSWVAIDGAREDLPFRLGTGETEVSFANADDRLIVVVDGERATFPFPGDPADRLARLMQGGLDRNSLAIAAVGLRATLTDVRVDRDLHYQPHLRFADESKIWKIPPGHYFMLGDNTRSSKDSREWRIAEARLQSGEVVRWQPGFDNPVHNPGAGDPHLAPDEVFEIETDVKGLVRRLRYADVASWSEEMASPFVPEDHLIGRAFAIFWPIHVPSLYKGGTRVGLIR